MSTKYEFHPFAEIWPLLEGADFEAFKQNIAKRGQIVPILTYQDKVLDGRNRYRACQELGIEPRTEPARVKDDDDALELVVSLNDQRRHMEAGARALAAARLANIRSGRHKEASRARLPSSITQEEAAKRLGVGLTSVKAGKAVLEYGDPELVKAVETGKVSVSAAAEKVRPKKPKPAKPGGRMSQAELRARAFEARAKHVGRNLTPEEVDPDFQGTRLEFVAKYGHVQGQTAAEKKRDDAITRAATLVTALRDFIKAVPADVSEDDILIWLDADGPKNRHGRIERLTSRVEDYKAICNRLHALFAQVESRLTGGPVEVKNIA